MDLDLIENELKKRLKFQYIWGRKQNNEWDKNTNFIYKILNFETLLETIEKKYKANFSIKIDRQDFYNYAVNRWYNFWSAMAVEKIFCSSEKVIPQKNSKDRLVDFNICGINFDHKTSIFPKGFPNDINFALNHKEKLITWLYKNQSKQQRMHLENRIFLVLHKSDGKHWKLKAEISWLKNIIEDYLETFSSDKLITLNLKKDNSTTLSDVIWVIK